jgi:hypothetical protein
MGGLRQEANGESLYLRRPEWLSFNGSAEMNTSHVIGYGWNTSRSQGIGAGETRSTLINSEGFDK